MSAIIVLIKAVSLIVVAVGTFLALAFSLGAEPFSAEAAGCAHSMTRTCFVSIV